MTSFGILSPSFSKPKPVRVSALSSSSAAVSLSAESTEATQSTESPSKMPGGDDHNQRQFEHHIKRAIDKHLSVDTLKELIVGKPAEPLKKRVLDTDNDDDDTANEKDSGSSESESTISERSADIPEELSIGRRKDEVLKSLVRTTMRPRTSPPNNSNIKAVNRAAPKRSNR